MTDIAEIGIRADITQLQNAVNELNRLASQGERTENRVTRSMGGVKAAFASIAGALGVGNAAGKLIEIERQTGILTSSLKTVTGSAKDAATAFEAIQVLASQLPESVNDVTTAFTKMANLGLDPSEAAIRSYSNTAAAMGKNLMDMIEAVADASTFEFERLKEFGIKSKQQGDNVSFTFQGVTTTVKKNSEAITGYLKSIGDVNFAGASADRMKTLDGAISNLGDTWDGLFRTINSAGAGELIASGVRGATEAIADLNNFIKSGQMSGYIDAIGERFQWVFDVAIAGFNTIKDAALGLYGLWYMMHNDAMMAMGTSTDEFFSEIIKGFTSAPENIKAFFQVIVVELLALSERASATGTLLAESLNPRKAFSGEAMANFRKEMERIDGTRKDSLQSIFDEKTAVEDSYDAQIKKANDLRAAFEAKNNAAKGDVLGQYGKGGGAAGPSEEAVKAAEKAAKEAAKAQEQLQESIADVLVGLNDQYLQLTMTKDAYLEYTLRAQGASDAQIDFAVKTQQANKSLEDSKQAAIDYQKSIDDITKSADDFGGAWSRTGSVVVDAFGSMADSLNDYMSQLDTLQKQREAIAKAESQPTKTAEQAIALEKAKAKLEQDSVKATLSGYGKMAGAAASMFSEQSKARKALNNAEKVFTAIEIGLALQKAAANATTAITAAFAAPWPIGFASGAAMIAIMAGLGVFSGSSGGGGPTTESVQDSQGTGSVLGSNDKSESISKTFENYSNIALDQLAELRGIRESLAAFKGGIDELALSLSTSQLSKENWLAFADTTFGSAMQSGFSLPTGGKGGKQRRSAALEPLQDQLIDMFKFISNTAAASLDSLGLAASGALDSFVISLGDISFKDLSGSEIQSELDAIFSKQADLMTMFLVPAMAEYQQMGEGLFETLTRVAKEQAVFNDTMENMGLSLGSLSTLMRIDVAQSIITLMGGLEEFSSKTSLYFEKFFSEDEKIKMLGDSLTEAFGSIGEAVPATRAGFRAMIEGLNLTAESDQKLFASLMELAPGLDEYLSAIEKETETKKEATTVTKDYAAIAAKQADMQIQLMEAQGMATEALAARRSRELSLLDESLRPLQEQIWAQQDLNKAMDATSANMKRVADERYGLETQLLQAQGNTQALRDRELAALDASNRPLQEQIWAIEAKAEADAKAAQLAQEASDSQQKAYDDAVQAAQDAADEQARIAKDAAAEQERLIKGTQDALTSAIRKLRGESEQLNDIDRQRAKNTLNAALTAAQAGQSIVGFAGLEDALNAVSNIDKSTFASAEDYQRELGRTLSILDRLSGYAGMPGAPTNPIVANNSAAIQSQTNQQMAQNIAAVEDQMTKLTVQIEDNTKRTKMMLERWEAIGMPVSRTA